MRVEEMNDEQIAIYRQAIRDKRWELFVERTRKKHERDQFVKDTVAGLFVGLACIIDWDYTIDNICKAMGW
jgi:hypothetical protein